MKANLSLLPIEWNVYLYFRLTNSEFEGDAYFLRGGNYKRLFPGWPIIATQRSIASRLLHIRKDLKAFIDKNNAALGVDLAVICSRIYTDNQ